jgi:inosine-uridine nucleoside N-ribohydrolase
VILDTDIGGDDAQALIYAIHEAKKTNRKIIGITCVNGNTTVENVARNAVIVQALCNTDIPIYLGTYSYNIGCESSMIGNMEKDFYFSKDGLG